METILQVADGRRPARHHRLLGRVRRLGGGDPRAAPRTRTSTRSIRSSSRRSRSSPAPPRATVSQDYDFTTFPEVVASAAGRLQAGRRHRSARSRSAWPRCTTASRRPSWCSMEDLGFSPRGTAWKDVLDGRFDCDGPQPVNPDGGLKSFGHPIGACGPAHDVRDVAPAPRRGGPAADQEPEARPDAQPGRRARGGA